ncbi:hypothetical protein PCASD_08279 [Puccinia coronata f. sp. avenae]|uniref:Uncharacterized protein n=1 Tax=Puccinia coronata f. sp. avenae TaxID=200324 RepID=A0A2N5V145_9BASI|nr:hypothetical protein PCASD_21500 [Puccinia coronata f. sp. avenae]PLW43715.1 hypothetical protein PCASD_08279 [Puccinia coronata f. sp. avenae]
MQKRACSWIPFGIRNSVHSSRLEPSSVHPTSPSFFRSIHPNRWRRMAPHEENDTINIRKVPRVRSGAEDAVRRCYEKNLGNCLSWITRFSELRLTDKQESRVQRRS